MPATKQISVRLPVEIAKIVESKGPIAPYIIEAVLEKLRREEQAEHEAGFALLARSPDMWDMKFPSGSQSRANVQLAAVKDQL